jgi:RNA polymerase sigma-70 factor (ECF subfamily)
VEESELINELYNHNPKAFAQLVDLYSPMVYSLVYKMIGTSQDAEDITQEVFIVIWTTIGSFKGESLLKTWVYRIAINKAHEFIRKKNRKKRKGYHISLEEKSNQLQENEPQPNELLEYQEMESAFNESLTKIPENQQIAFLLHRFEGLSYNEIAQEMKISHSAVESLIFRAKQNVSKWMKKYLN